MVPEEECTTERMEEKFMLIGLGDNILPRCPSNLEIKRCY